MCRNRVHLKVIPADPGVTTIVNTDAKQVAQTANEQNQVQMDCTGDDGTNWKGDIQWSMTLNRKQLVHHTVL